MTQLGFTAVLRVSRCQKDDTGTQICRLNTKLRLMIGSLQTTWVHVYKWLLPKTNTDADRPLHHSHLGGTKISQK